MDGDNPFSALFPLPTSPFPSLFFLGLLNDLHLIKISDVVCHCSLPMILCYYSQATNRYILKCNNKHKRCITHDSFFFHSSLTIISQLKLIDMLYSRVPTSYSRS